MQYNNFAMAMSSLKEFACARKKEPCPSNTSPISTSQLSMSTVETPVKEQSVYADAKPPVEHTPLADFQGNQTGGFTLEQNVHSPIPLQHTDAKPSVEHNRQANAQTNPAGVSTLEQNSHYATSFQHTGAKPSVECTLLGNARGKPVGDFALEQNVHCATSFQRTTARPSFEQRSLATAQRNQISGFTPSSNLLRSCVSDVASKSMSFSAERVASKLDKFKRKSGDQDGNERKVFNGMTLVLDFKPVNGANLLTAKCNELKVDGKMQSQASDCAVKKNPESENVSREQLSSSPLLFGTPQSSPSSSPVKQEVNSFTPAQCEERTSLNTSNLNLVHEEASAIKSVENGERNLDDNSISTLKKGDEFWESSLVEEAGSQGFVTPRKLFKSKEDGTCPPGHGEHANEIKEEKKPRDILDDVKENISHEKAELENCLQTTTPKVERNVDSKESVQKGKTNLTKRSDRSSNSAPEMSSNVRQGRRRSIRLRRSSNSTGKTKKEEKDACEVGVSPSQSDSAAFIGITKLAPTLMKATLLIRCLFSYS